jgi:hypothetical protein
MAREKLPCIQRDELREHILQHCVKANVRVTETVTDYTSARARCYKPFITKKRVAQAGFYKVVKEMHVFKKVYVPSRKGGKRVEGIANLIIPVGAMIHASEWTMQTSGYSNDGGRKMRASEAYTHSIFTLKSQRKSATAFSAYDRFYQYTEGREALPSKFDKDDTACASGIHFFVNLEDAIAWRW